MSITDNLKKLKDYVTEAAIRSNRRPDDIKIVAVSKTHPPVKIIEAFEAGQRTFGENKVQEAITKISKLPSEIEWHLVGHLQTNKAKTAASLFSVIQSIDSLKLAEKLDKYSLELRKKLDVFVQLDLADEETKFGVSENYFHTLCDFLDKAEGLNLVGLMCLPPYFDDAEKTRPYFAKLREHLEKYNLQYAKKIYELSMGMSHDYIVAIEEGATIIRIGTAIFGERI